MSVGTEIRYGDTMAPDHGWEEELNQGWNREAIVEEGKKLNLKFQVDLSECLLRILFCLGSFVTMDDQALLQSKRL